MALSIRAAQRSLCDSLNTMYRVPRRAALSGALFLLACTGTEATAPGIKSESFELASGRKSNAETLVKESRSAVAIFPDNGVPLPLPPGQLPPAVSPSGVAPGTPVVARVHVNSLLTFEGIAGPFSVTLLNPSGGVHMSWSVSSTEFGGHVDLRFIAGPDLGRYEMIAKFHGSSRTGPDGVTHEYLPSTGSTTFLVALPCGTAGAPACPPPPCGGIGQPPCNSEPVGSIASVGIFLDLGAPLPPAGQGFPPEVLLPPNGVAPGTRLIARIHARAQDARGSGLSGNFHVTQYDPNGVVIREWDVVTPAENNVFDIYFTATTPTGFYKFRADYAGMVRNGITYLPGTGSMGYRVVVNNTPPVARITGPQVLVRTSPAGAEGSLDGSTSSDAEGPITYEWFLLFGPNIPPQPIGTGPTVSGTLQLGNHNIMLRVRDSGGLTSTAFHQIEVRNAPPVAVIAPFPQLECSAGGALANLNGASSTDVDGTIVNYSWTSGAGNRTGAASTLFVPLGVTPVSLTVRDNNGATGSASASITVVDTTPPTISGTVLTTDLGAPNHKMVKVAAGIRAMDSCSGPTPVSVAVKSNEPINGTGDGNTDADWAVVSNADGSYDVYLRSERSGSKESRVYTITATATDAGGMSASKTITVMVPHNK